MFGPITTTQKGERTYAHFERDFSSGIIDYRDLFEWLRENIDDFRIINARTIAFSSPEDATLLILRWQST